jgi:hypothetical protein
VMVVVLLERETERYQSPLWVGPPTAQAHRQAKRRPSGGPLCLRCPNIWAEVHAAVHS